MIAILPTPIRNFCKRSMFYQVKVTYIDLDEKSVSISTENNKTKLNYDYLVIAAGTKTIFFGNENLKNILLQ